MRPKRSVAMPPTNPADTPRRAMPTAMLRQEPPTTGTMASRPSTDLTGRKSIKASPQLKSIVLCLCHPAHDIAAFPVQFPHQSVDLSLGPVEVLYSGRRRFAQAPDRRHRRHRLADRSVTTAGDRAEHSSSEQDGLLCFWERNLQPRGIRHDLADQSAAGRPAADHYQVAVDPVRPESVDDVRKPIGEAA